MADYNMLFQAPNAGLAFAQGVQQGQQARQQGMAKQALAALTVDPSNQRALQALASVDPQSAIQWRQQQAELVKQQLAQHQDNILKGAEIVRQLQPKDQAGWDQARAAAAQAGIDLSQVPAQFDPQYAQGLTSIADAWKPLSTDGDQVVVTPQPGAPALIYNKRTGTSQVVVAPNDGTHPVGAPAGNVPRVIDQASYDAVPAGGQYMDPSGHIRTKGGQAGNGSTPAGFPR